MERALDWESGVLGVISVLLAPSLYKLERLLHISELQDLEIVILSEESQKEKDKSHMTSLIRGI